MDQWQRVADAADVGEKPIAVELEDESQILLVRVNGKIRATDNSCPHYGAPLSDGVFKEGMIICPWHNTTFDVETGKLDRTPSLDDLTTYEVKEEDGGVFLGQAIENEISMPDGSDDRRVLILGAGAAAIACAEALRRERFAGEIELLTRESHAPYDRPMLSKGLISGEAPPKYLPLRPNGFYKKLGITVTTGVEITSMDPANKTLRSMAGDEYRGDMVLLATGGVPRTLPLPGAERDGVYTLRTQDDAERIMEAAKAARRAVILGASFIGMEVAAQFRAQDIAVTVVEPEKQPLIRNLGEEIGRWLRETHEKEGVRFKLGTKAKEITGNGSATGLSLETGESLEADLILMAVGVEPRVDYLEGTKLVSDPSKGVRVNEHLETDAPGVYAAGDIALYPAGGSEQRVEHWVHAEEQGRHVARAMLGSDKPYTRLPFFWTRQYETGLKFAGYPTAFESIVFDGTPGKGEFLAGFFTDDKLTGVASMGKAERFNNLGDELEAGATITPEEFSR